MSITWLHAQRFVLCGLGYLISEGHEVVAENQTLEDDHPAGVLEPFRYEVDQSCELTSWVVGQLQQVWRDEREGGMRDEQVFSVCGEKGDDM